MGPFEPYPARAGVVRAEARTLARSGTRMYDAAYDAARATRPAVANVLGALVAPVTVLADPVLATGTTLRSAAELGASVIRTWAEAIQAYDKTVVQLNTEWHQARTAGFGISDPNLTGSMSAAAVADAKSGHHTKVVAAREALLADLARRERAAARTLNDTGDELATRLDRGPEAIDWTNVRTTGSAPITYTGDDGGSGWMGPEERAERDYEERVENYDPDTSPSDILGWLGKNLIFDPGACSGDEAGAGACGLEIAAVTPWTKWLKGLKLANKAKKAGEAAEDVNKGTVPPPKVEAGKQGKHQEGHPNYDPSRSTLEADPDELAERAGTGVAKNKVPRGEPGFKEVVDYGKPIGKYMDPQTGEAVATTKAILHYSKNGIHIVPARP